MTTTLQQIEDRIRTLAFQNRLRIKEFFKDFDPLNSGKVSRSQFRRCLMILNINITDDEYDKIIQEYMDTQNPDLIHYSRFVESIDKVFTLNNLEKTPTKKMYNIEPMLSTLKIRNTLSPEREEAFQKLLKKMQAETRSRSYILKDYFKQFDRHNHGVVTKSQFIQCLLFTFPISKEEYELLIDKYVNNKGLVNYMHFHDDCTEVEQIFEESHALPITPKEVEEQITEVEQIEKILKSQLLKHRIRIHETFRDYDPLRKGIITISQFYSAIGSIKFPKFALTKEHLKLLEKKYTINVDGVDLFNYNEFIKNMDSVFVDTGLERLPTKEFKPQDLNLQTKTVFDKEDEEKLEKLLDEIRFIVKSRRILLMPLFRDFDQVTKGVYATRYTTRERFERALHTLGIKFSPEEYKLLSKKYDDKNDGTVNYESFIKDVDHPLGFAVAEGNIYLTVKTLLERSSPLPITPRKQEQKSITFDELIQKMKVKAYVDRIRISEYMIDFDPLRCGKVKKHHFRTALTLAGIHLDDYEFNILCDVYGDGTDFIRWKQCMDDVESIFTEKELERTPQKVLSDSQKLVKSFTQKFTDREVDPETEEILSKLSYITQTTRIYLKPEFQHFDKLRSGKVNKTHFMRCMKKLFNANPKDVEKIMKLFEDERTGQVQYLKFIDALDPSEIQKLSKKIERKFVTPKRDVKDEKVDLNDLLYRIKSKISKDRIRIETFFEDYDKLKSKQIPSAKFRSALSMAGIELKENEFKTLEDHYRISTEGYNHTGINYVAFCEEIEKVFVEKYLEKTPLKEFKKFIAKHSYEVPEKEFSQEELQILDEAITNLRNWIKANRTLPKPYFQDFDRVNKQRVTPSQFSSVLNFLKFKVSSAELDVLLKRFMDERGDIDYVSFCNMIDSSNEGSCFM